MPKQHLHLSAQYPQRVHIEANMNDAAMHKYGGKKAPQFTRNNGLIYFCQKCHNQIGIKLKFHKILRQEHKDGRAKDKVSNNRFYRWGFNPNLLRAWWQILRLSWRIQWRRVLGFMRISTGLIWFWGHVLPILLGRIAIFFIICHKSTLRGLVRMCSVWIMA